MQSLIPSRSMAQMVAFDLMDEERRQAEVRRGRRGRRRAAASTGTEQRTPEPRQHRWRVARALHLVH